MMKEYLNKEIVLNTIEEEFDKIPNGRIKKNIHNKIMDSICTLTAEPVFIIKLGYWKKDRYGLVCSNCDFKIEANQAWNYCPNCASKNIY